MLPQNRNKSTKPSVLPQMTDMDVASSLHPLANLESQNKNNLSYNIIMNKSNLSKLTKGQLIELLRAILQESEAKLEMKNFNPSSIFVCR